MFPPFVDEEKGSQQDIFSIAAYLYDIFQELVVGYIPHKATTQINWDRDNISVVYSLKILNYIISLFFLT